MKPNYQPQPVAAAVPYTLLSFSHLLSWQQVYTDLSTAAHTTPEFDAYLADLDTTEGQYPEKKQWVQGLYIRRKADGVAIFVGCTELPFVFKHVLEAFFVLDTFSTALSAFKIPWRITPCSEIQLYDHLTEESQLLLAPRSRVTERHFSTTVSGWWAILLNKAGRNPPHAWLYLTEAALHHTQARHIAAAIAQKVDLFLQQEQAAA